MKKLMIVIGAALMAAGASAGESFAYQGVLKTGTGGQVTTADQTIYFRLYNEAVSDVQTTAIWGRKVAVRLDTNGLFNVELSDSAGSAIDKLTNTLDVAFAKSAKAKKDLYLGLWVVGSVGEIRPRQKLLATPISSFARDVNLAKGDFTVDGIATFNGSINLGKATKVVGDAKFDGTATFAKSATFSNGLTASGTATFNNGITISGGTYGAMPPGTIVMWWGEITNIPTGWALCDGQDGRPDLRGRFPVGAGAGTAGSYNMGQTGGSTNVTLTVDQLPSHNHKLQNVGGGLCVDGGRGNKTHYMERKYSDGWDWTNPTTDVAGGGQAHENRPPYFGIYFIIRVK